MTALARRTGGVAAFAATSFALCAPASAATVPGPDAAASYLAAEMAANGHQLTTTFSGQSWPDSGLTADGILALGSIGSAGTEAAAATSAFEASATSYAGSGTELSAGGTAKSLIVALAQGRSTTNFGGVNLVAQLKGLETAEGRFSSKSAYGDYSNAITQSLAIVGLAKAGAPADAKAVSYLLAQQCADGGFRSSLDATGCTSDTDATSFAIQALAAAGGHGAQLTKAAGFLAAKQGADGGLVGGSGAPTENTNSTGIAAVAFAIAGQGERAAKAQSFVASLQYGCAFPAAVRGAFAYDKAAYASMKAAGSAGKAEGNETRATAQAVLAFTKQPYLATGKPANAAVPMISCSSSTSAPASPKPSTSSTASTSTSAPSTSAPATSVPSASSTTTAPAPSTATSTAAPTSAAAAASGTASSAPSRGPVVNTDLTSSSTLPFGLAAGTMALVAAGGALAFARRR